MKGVKLINNGLSNNRKITLPVNKKIQGPLSIMSVDSEAVSKRTQDIHTNL